MCPIAESAVLAGSPIVGTYAENAVAVHIEGYLRKQASNLSRRHFAGLFQDSSKWKSNCKKLPRPRSIVKHVCHMLL